MKKKKTVMKKIDLLKINSSLLIVFILMFLTSCTFKNETEISHKVLIKRVDFDKKKAIEKAKIILNNNVYVWDLWDPVPYENEIDWSINPYQNNSWMLYFQSLRMVGILARAYEFENNSLYIDKGLEIIYSWDKNKETSSGYVWDEHAVANRVLNLTHFYFSAIDVLSNSNKKKIEKIIEIQGRWLYDDKNYKKGNHAIMQDRALMQLSLVFDFNDSKKWFNKSYTRIIEMFKSEITEEGVCVENSPFYHTYVMNLFKDLINIHHTYELPIDESLLNSYDKTKEFLVYITKPDRTLPAIGDTYHSESSVNFYREHPNDELEYVSTKGEHGVTPKQIDKIYPKSGYAILREGWGRNDDFDKMTQLTFINTNQSKVHKHADYLSFELFSNEEELIVDPGHMGYEKDSVTQYLKSYTAHNTLSVDLIDYDIRDIPLFESAYIEEQEKAAEIVAVKGVFTPDSTITFNRKIVYIKPNVFVLIDNVEQEENTKYSTVSQTFNFGKNLISLKKDNNNKIKATFKNNTLHIYQYNRIDTLQIFNEESELRGKIADGSLKYRQGTQIVFERNIKSKKEELITVFLIENKKANNIKKNEIDLHVQGNKVIITTPLNRYEVIK